MKPTLPDQINGASVLQFAETRDPSTPWIVLCEDPSESPRYFIVALVTRAGSKAEEAYHAWYATALEDFRARCAIYAPTRK
jgi:hypothetical protein